MDKHDFIGKYLYYRANNAIWRLEDTKLADELRTVYLGLGPTHSDGNEINTITIPFLVDLLKDDDKNWMLLNDLKAVEVLFGNKKLDSENPCAEVILEPEPGIKRARNKV